MRLLKKANGAREVIMDAEQMEAFVENHFGDTHTLSVPRDTFTRLGGYPLAQPVCEDVHFLIRLCAISKRVGVICEPMGVYLIRPDSATRADSLRSQRLTVEALRPLKTQLESAPPAIKRGFRARLRRARLNLAYALLRQREGAKALATVLASLMENHSLSAFRDVASVAWGALRGGGPL